MQKSFKIIVFSACLTISNGLLSQQVEQPPDAVPSSTAVTAESIELLIAQLGSAEFAQREAASIALSELGAPTLVYLEAASQHPDMEVRSRAEMIYREVYQEWFEDQARRFIAGDDSTTAFEAWPMVKRLMGDSESVRSLFVSMSRRYPDFVVALAQPLASRVAAGELFADQSFQRQLQLVDPTIDDLVGLLLVACDEPVKLSESFHSRVMQLIRLHAFNEAMKSPLADPLRKLAAVWAMRSPTTIRDNVLNLTSTQRWPVGAELARATLAEEHSEPPFTPEAIHWATIVLLEFGNTQDLYQLLPHLDDKREIFPGQLNGNAAANVPPADLSVTEVRDVVMAGCFRFCEVQLEDAGFPQAKAHSRMFDLEAMAFPVVDPSIRVKVRSRLDELLKSREQAKKTDSPK